MEHSDLSTCTAREVQTATRLVLPGYVRASRSLVLLVALTAMCSLHSELAKHAVSEGTKAVTKYTSNLAETPRRAARSVARPRPACSSLSVECSR